MNRIFLLVFVGILILIIVVVWNMRDEVEKKKEYIHQPKLINNYSLKDIKIKQTQQSAKNINIGDRELSNEYRMQVKEKVFLLGNGKKIVLYCPQSSNKKTSIVLYGSVNEQPFSVPLEDCVIERTIILLEENNKTALTIKNLMNFISEDGQLKINIRQTESGDFSVSKAHKGLLPIP